MRLGLIACLQYLPARLTVTATGIARITVFGDPGLVTGFGFPPER